MAITCTSTFPPTDVYWCQIQAALQLPVPRPSSRTSRLTWQLFPFLAPWSTEKICASEKRSLHRYPRIAHHRSEEHTSELQSPDHLVCRLLLEKKKNRKTLKFLIVSRQVYGDADVLSIA